MHEHVQYPFQRKPTAHKALNPSRTTPVPQAVELLTGLGPSACTSMEQHIAQLLGGDLTVIGVVRVLMLFWERLGLILPVSGWQLLKPESGWGTVGHNCCQLPAF